MPLISVQCQHQCRTPNMGIADESHAGYFCVSAQTGQRCQAQKQSNSRRKNALVLIAASHAPYPIVYDFSGNVSGAMGNPQTPHQRDPPDLLSSVSARPGSRGRAKLIQATTIIASPWSAQSLTPSVRSTGSSATNLHVHAPMHGRTHRSTGHGVDNMPRDQACQEIKSEFNIMVSMAVHVATRNACRQRQRASGESSVAEVPL